MIRRPRSSPDRRKMPRTRETVPGILKDETFAALLGYIENHPTFSLRLKARLYLGSLLLYCTGLRVNELRFFNRQNIQAFLDRQVLSLDIRTKTGFQPRELTQTDSGALFHTRNRYKIEYFITVFFVPGTTHLLSATDGRNLSPQHVIRTFNTALSAFGRTLSTVDGTPLRYRTHSAFRHSYVQRLSSAGIDIHTIAKMIGHRSVSTTSRYNIRQLTKTELRRYASMV